MSETSKQLKAALATYYATFPSLPDGIYIGLPAERYHADTALGSSNIRELLNGANLYWHGSAMNPHRPKEKKTDALAVGDAVHKLLLEGRKAFDAVFVRGPYGDDDDYSPAEKAALTKSAKSKLQEGQHLLAQADYDFVVDCKSILDTDPKLKGCLDNALTEVSIFWTRPDGVRVKVRHDALKLRGIGDIKTIANERRREMSLACRLDIATYRYDIPAQHYSNGRLQVATLLAEGNVFAGEECAKLDHKNNADAAVLEFLKKVAGQKQFGFQLVFIPKKGAPDAWSCTLTPGNPIMVSADGDIEHAIAVFKGSLERFGHEKRWIPDRDVNELDINEMPVTFGRRG